LRYAYNRYVDNKGKVEFKLLYKDLYSKFNLNRRYIYDIISQAYIDYCFHKSNKKKNGHDVCFGTAENFIRYNNWEISKDELLSKRNRLIHSTSEKHLGGNNNHFVEKGELGQYWIKSTLLRDNEGHKKSHSCFKSGKNILYIPKEFREEFDRQEKWKIKILNTWVEKGYYEVRISYRNDSDYLDHKNIISLDLNHNTLDYSVIVDKNRSETKSIELNLSGKKNSKQQILINIIKHKLIPLAFKYKSHFVIENLSQFKNDKKSIKSKKARRKIGSISRQMFMDLIVSISKKSGIKTDLVNPKYTSFIATKKYSNEFKNKDQGASYVIGRKRTNGKYYRSGDQYDYYDRLPRALRVQALFIVILYNIRNLFTNKQEKIKFNHNNQSLWWYLYHTTKKRLTNLKDSLNVLEFNSSCDGSIGLLELILKQIENLVTLTESDKDFKDYEFLRNLSIRLREIRKDYTLNSGIGALL
jgi:IS605 OrfB family transposase